MNKQRSEMTEFKSVPLFKEVNYEIVLLECRQPSL